MRPSAGTLALGALLAVVVAAGALVGPGRAPAPGRESTLWLAVESRALDGDRIDTPADRARFRARFGHEPQEILLESADRDRVYEAPGPWTALAALARRLLGASGPFLLQGGLLALAALAAAATIRPRLGAVGGPLLVGVTLLGTAALGAALALEPHALEAAAVAVAAAAVWRRGFGREAPPADVYQGEATGAPGLGRWLLAGGAMGIASAGSVAYLPLLLPLVAAAPERRRLAARLLFFGGAAAALAAIVATSGAPWPPLDPVASTRLWGWSGVGLLVGRGVGLLPFYLPAALLVAAAGRDEGRRWVLPAVALALLAQVLLAPFDFVETSLAGNAWFLPPLVLLLAAASHGESRAWTVAVALAGMPFVLAPVLLTPLGFVRTAATVERWVEPVARLLPEPTTLRAAPGAADLRRPGLVARGVAPGLDAGRGGLRLVERRGRLVVVSERALSSLRLELGADAPVAIALRGGKLGNTTLRPSGELALDVALDAGDARRHPVWWSRGGAWIHALELELPARPSAPIALDVAFGRPVVPDAAEAGGGGRERR